MSRLDSKRSGGENEGEKYEGREVGVREEIPAVLQTRSTLEPRPF